MNIFDKTEKKITSELHKAPSIALRLLIMKLASLLSRNTIIFATSTTSFTLPRSAVFLSDPKTGCTVPQS